MRMQCPLWVKSRHVQCKRHVRFTPKSGHVRCTNHVRFVPISGHPEPPCPLADFRQIRAARGRVTMISVNSPGCVSTSIEPACCLTIMSWLMERPRPVPSPVGLVVKNGLNIFSFTSGGIPVPLSRILISTRSPRFLGRRQQGSARSRRHLFPLLRLVAA